MRTLVILGTAVLLSAVALLSNDTYSAASTAPIKVEAPVQLFDFAELFIWWISIYALMVIGAGVLLYLLIRWLRRKKALKKGALAFVIIVALAVAVWLGVLLTWSPVAFPDAGLKRAIRDELGWPPGELTDLTFLNARGKMKIGDLTGIEYCVNLTYLHLSGNRISDLSPLVSLTKLKFLSIGDNPFDKSEGSEAMENY